MNNEEIAVKLTEVEQRGKSNTHRIDRMEKNQEALNRLATSVEVLATNIKNMAEKVDKIDGKVEQLEAVPSDRWRTLISCAISAGISAVITFLVHKFL